VRSEGSFYCKGKLGEPLLFPAGKPHTSCWISWLGRGGTSFGLVGTMVASVPFFPFKKLFWAFVLMPLVFDGWSAGSSFEKSLSGELNEQELGKWLAESGGGRRGNVWRPLEELIRTCLEWSESGLWDITASEWGEQVQLACANASSCFYWWTRERESGSRSDLGKSLLDSSSFFLSPAFILLLLAAHGNPMELPNGSLVPRAAHPAMNWAEPGLPQAP
jgi:hypothetical protein